MWRKPFDFSQYAPSAGVDTASSSSIVFAGDL
jgi:hypothetical protein